MEETDALIHRDLREQLSISLETENNAGLDFKAVNDVKEEEITSNFGLAVMLLRGMIGLGIFILPHTAHFVGVWGFTVMYPIIFMTLSSYVLLIVYVANEVGYKGRR